MEKEWSHLGMFRFHIRTHRVDCSLFKWSIAKKFWEESGPTYELLSGVKAYPNDLIFCQFLWEPFHVVLMAAFGFNPRSHMGFWVSFSYFCYNLIVPFEFGKVYAVTICL